MLLLVDTLVLYSSAYAGYLVRFVGLPGSLAVPIAGKAVTFTAVMLYMFYLTELYDYHKRQTVYRRIMFAFLFGFFPMVVIFYFIPSLSVGRGWFIASYGFAGIFIMAWRRGAEPLLEKFRPHERVLVVGTGAAALNAVDILKESGEHLYEIAGFVSLPGNPRLVPPEKVVQPKGSMAEFASGNRIDKVVVAADDRRGPTRERPSSRSRHRRSW